MTSSKFDRISVPSECSGYLKRKNDVIRGQKCKERKWILYWVQLKGSKLQFYDDTLENAFFTEDRLPPDDTIAPCPEHICLHEEFELKNIVVKDILHYKNGRCKHVFDLEHWHECEPGRCPEKCKQRRQLDDHIFLQAPNDTRRANWVTILRQIANCAEQFLKSLELRGIIKKKEKILSTEEQAKFELLQEQLFMLHGRDEQLALVSAEINKCKNIHPILHYKDDTTGESVFVDTHKVHLRTKLRKDYYLYPGVEWSKLAAGTEVRVLGKTKGNIFCVQTLKAFVCNQKFAKWDSGFLSVQKETFSDSEDNLTNEGSGVFHLEIEEKRHASSCPSTPINWKSERSHAFSWRDEDGAELIDTSPRVANEDHSIQGNQESPMDLSSLVKDPSAVTSSASISPPRAPPPEGLSGDSPREDYEPAYQPPGDGENLGDMPTDQSDELTMPLVGFIAGSALEAFSHEKIPDAKTSASPTGMHSNPSTPQDHSYKLSDDHILGEDFLTDSKTRPFNDVSSRSNKDNIFKVFKELWKADSDSDSDCGDLEGSLTPPSRSLSSYSIVSLDPTPSPFGTSPASSSLLETPHKVPKEYRSFKKKKLSKSVSDSISLSVPKQVHFRRYIPGRGSLMPWRRISSKRISASFIPPFGTIRECYVNPGGPATELGIGFSYIEPRRTQVQSVFVGNVIHDSPVYKAGIFVGDAVLKVNSIDVRFMSSKELIEVIHIAKERANIDEKSILFEVQWKNGMEILKKEDEHCKKEKDLLQLQEELLSLIEREKEIFSWISTYIPFEEDSEDKELESDLGTGSYEGDLMTTEYFPLSSLKTDYLVCPISSNLTSIDSNLKEAKALKDIHDFAGNGLREELALLLPPLKGEVILTKAHKINAKGIFHLVVGPAYQSLKSACLKALLQANKLSAQQLVFAGFSVEGAKILMNTILSEMPDSGEACSIRNCVFVPDKEETINEYSACCSLVKGKDEGNMSPTKNTSKENEGQEMDKFMDLDSSAILGTSSSN